MKNDLDMQISEEGLRCTGQPHVLYLTKVYPYPPATAGDAVYSKGIVEALAYVCNITVICADSSAATRESPRIDWHIIGPEKSGQVGSILSRWPLIAWKNATRNFESELARLLEKRWDAIVLDNLGLVHALPRVKEYREKNPATRLVYISHEHEFPTRRAKYDSYRLNLPKRLVASRDLDKVRNSEEDLIRCCDIVTVINTSDLKPFREIAPENKYLSLMPGYNGPVVKKREINKDVLRRVLLLGGRQSEQKRQILLDWMAVAYGPLKTAGIEMVVVGDMDDSLRQILSKDYPDTQVLGFVDDLGVLISSARMGLIVDTVGGGFKMRLLSHVFQRLPIVGLGDAIDGLPTSEGQGYLGASDLHALVGLVCEVIEDVGRLNALHETAFDHCAKSYSWSTRAAAFVGAITGNTSELL